MPWAVAAAWKSGDDYHRTRGCHNTHDGNVYGGWHANCKGDFWEGTHKGRGRRTRFHCASACGNKVQYARGAGGHPCSGANHIQGIPINISGRDHVGLRGALGNPPGAFWCRFADNSGTMIAASRRRQNTGGGVGGNSVYNQLLFGTRYGGYADGGYCGNVDRISHRVHHDGRTCYQMLQGKVGATAAKVRAIQYCERHRTDPKCACINVSGSGFIERCKKHTNWAGCKDVLKGISDFEKVGLSSASGLYGNADCLVPGICSGDVYEPNTRLSSCANKMAICNQIMKLDNIKAAAGIKAVQGCNINFEAEQKKKDAAKAKAEADAKAKAEAEAKAKAKAAADAKAKAAADAKAKAEADAKAAAAAKSAGGKAPAGAATAVATKSKGGGLPGGISPVRGGVVSFSLFCCSLIILLIILRMGGKGNNK